MICFRETEVTDAKKILGWRISDRVSKYMKTNIKNDLDLQIKWLRHSFIRPNYYHWIIQHQGNDIGLLYFSDWEPENTTTSWGFYIGEEKALGLGGLVAPYFHNFAFEVLRVQRVLAECFYNNTAMIDLHLKAGYKFDLNRNHLIKKNGNEVLVICMSLEKSAFQKSIFAQFKQDLPIKKWKKRLYEI